MTPYELWIQAQGDPDVYHRLMVEHGHIVKREPGDDSANLPCGWLPKVKRVTL